MRQTASTGHLKRGSLHLQQTEKVRQGLSKATTSHYALKKVQPVQLGWKRKTD